jgi:hypothetical protein
MDTTLLFSVSMGSKMQESLEVVLPRPSRNTTADFSFEFALFEPAVSQVVIDRIHTRLCHVWVELKISGGIKVLGKRIGLHFVGRDQDSLPALSYIVARQRLLCVR